MQQRVDPPRPVILLAFFTFVVLFLSMFIILPVVFGVASMVAASIELMFASNNVSGDFSGIVVGKLLWWLAGLPYGHLIIASVLIVLGTVGFVVFTKMVNKE